MLYNQDNLITQDKIKQLKSLSKAERILATRSHFGYYMVYYMPHYVQSEFAPFHYDMMGDVHDLLNFTIRELAWIMFRESAKTSLAKGLICYLITNRIEPYINVDSYDKENAERVLFDVVQELQSNKRLIEDFGQLYNVKRSAGEATQKRVTNFLTNPVKDSMGRILTPGIRVEAHSTQEPMRGRLSVAARPGFVLLDDFETKKTVASEATTKAIRDHIQEFKGGLDSQRRRVLYLGNYISEYANVQMLMDKEPHDPELRVRVVPIHSGDQPAWPQRYVMTDKEAQATGLVSIEAKKRNMWTPEDGDADFMAEMLCQPIDFATAVFQKHFFQHIEFEEMLKKRLVCYVTMDTPSKREDQAQNNDGDFFGVTINWVDAENKWHFKSYRKRLGPTAIIEEMFSIYAFCLSIGTPPIKMAWEDTAYTRGLEVALRKAMRERNIFLPLYWLSTAGRNKNDRIRTGLLHRYESRSIYHLTNECNDLEGELLRYPKSPFDDTSDSASYQADIAKPPGAEQTAKTNVPNGRIDNNNPYQRRQYSAYEADEQPMEVLHSDIGL